nr:ribosome-inactivating protein [Tanacetum cinerariifolium]
FGTTNNSSRQAWSANSEPTINYISGLREMCLQANDAYARVWLANSVIGTVPRQQWALYGDSNIRLYSDHTLCVTSNGHESSDNIFLLKGQGSGDERRTFMADGTILNPNARLVMDVRNSDVSLKEIILMGEQDGTLVVVRVYSTMLLLSAGLSVAIRFKQLCLQHHVDMCVCLVQNACHIKDPKQNIEWTVPEGGGEPVRSGGGGGRGGGGGGADGFDSGLMSKGRERHMEGEKKGDGWMWVGINRLRLAWIRVEEDHHEEKVIEKRKINNFTLKIGITPTKRNRQIEKVKEMI